MQTPTSACFTHALWKDTSSELQTAFISVCLRGLRALTSAHKSHVVTHSFTGRKVYWRQYIEIVSKQCQLRLMKQKTDGEYVVGKNQTTAFATDSFLICVETCESYVQGRSDHLWPVPRPVLLSLSCGGPSACRWPQSHQRRHSHSVELWV